MDDSPLEREHSLSVVLPGGQEKNATVHGSKPVMDLLVTLCASYHLNPSDYTVEVLSPSNNNISFTPNSPIGLLEAEKIVLKPRGGEEKIRTPYMPEATVRLLINYNKSHKTVVRVNPRLPLERLLPVVCDKCEFQVESTVLLRDSESKEVLDLSRTLNEHGLREVFAKDTAAKEYTEHQLYTAVGIASNKVSSSSSLQDLTKREKKKSESKGLFSLFRKHRKKSEPTHAVSAPTSPGLKSRSASISTQDIVSCVTPPADLPKKRPAPPPPMGASNTTPNHLSTCPLQRSGDDTLRRTKRRAPPPPLPVATCEQDVHVETTKDSLKSLDELKESEEPELINHPSPPPSPLPPSPPPPPPSPPSAPPLHKTPDSNRPTIRGKDLLDARAALAKVLTSSLSNGMMVKRFQNSTPFHKVQNVTACTSENNVEMKSLLNTNLPTENEFEDPADRKGFTTFKVAPSRRESDAEPIQENMAKEETDPELEKAEEQVISEDDRSLKAEDSPDQLDSSSPIINKDEQEEEEEEEETTSCSLPLDRSSSNLDEVEDCVDKEENGETSTDDHKAEDESDQGHENNDLYLGEEETEACPSDSDACDSKTCDDKVEQNTQEENFPPPPPPVYFSEDVDEANASLPGSVTNGHVRSSSEPPHIGHSPGNPEKTVSAPNRFAQAVAMAVQRSRLHSTGSTISALVHRDT